MTCTEVIVWFLNSPYIYMYTIMAISCNMHCWCLHVLVRTIYWLIYWCLLSTLAIFLL
jgi:hypothetical protein